MKPDDDGGCIIKFYILLFNALENFESLLMINMNLLCYSFDSSSEDASDYSSDKSGNSTDHVGLNF